MGPFQDEDGHLTEGIRTWLRCLMHPLSLPLDGPRESQCPELEEHHCENDRIIINGGFPVNPILLLCLDPFKPVGSDGIHPSC